MERESVFGFRGEIAKNERLVMFKGVLKFDDAVHCVFMKRAGNFKVLYNVYFYSQYKNAQGSEYYTSFQICFNYKQL